VELVKPPVPSAAWTSPPTPENVLSLGSQNMYCGAFSALLRYYSLWHCNTSRQDLLKNSAEVHNTGVPVGVWWTPPKAETLLLF